MDSTPGTGFERSLRRLASGLLELAQVRLELAGVEAREEAARWGELLLYGALAVLMLSLGLGFLAVFLTVLLWDSHRLVALAVFATLFLTLGGVAFVAARARLQRPAAVFAASIEELERDRAVLDPQAAGAARADGASAGGGAR